MRQRLVALERHGLEALQSSDIPRFGALVADDAILVDASGVVSKAKLLDQLSTFKIDAFEMSGIHTAALSDSSGVISYRVSEKILTKDAVIAVITYVSSVWMKRGEKWLLVFSQETSAR